MLTINNNSIIEAILRDFEKNQKIIAQNKAISGKLAKKTPLIIVLKAFRNLISIKKNLRTVYKMFLKSDIRTKEDIFLEVEKTKNGLKIIADENPSSFFGQLYYNLNNRIVIEFSVFEQKLKKELYGNIEESYSLQELQEMASKYKDIPKEILENISSDKYAAKFL